VPLDLDQDAATLAAALVDVYSESGHEAALADEVADALGGVGHLEVLRDGDAVVARTGRGAAERVVVAGHLDTVPPADNLPSRLEDGRLYGLGSADMKAGLAVMLRLARHVAAPARDVTYVFYDGEEVESARNGLLRVGAAHPDWLAGDFAVLMEPTSSVVEGGCQGTLRAEVAVSGSRAHSARSWLGDNAIHGASRVLDVLRDYRPRRPVVDGLEFREGLNAVGITGGVAGNVVPDRCVVTVNYRFAPDRSVVEAEEHVRSLFDGLEVTVVDVAGGARPGLTAPAAADFVAAVGGTPRAKLGWTDVARFAALDVPAVNFGPGDPAVAHTKDEHVAVSEVLDVEARMRGWLDPRGAGSVSPA
jgi:succinyl-diaminopimelate desuccinylase